MRKGHGKISWHETPNPTVEGTLPHIEHNEAERGHLRRDRFATIQIERTLCTKGTDRDKVSMNCKSVRKNRDRHHYSISQCEGRFARSTQGEFKAASTQGPWPIRISFEASFRMAMARVAAATQMSTSHTEKLCRALPARRAGT